MKRLVVLISGRGSNMTALARFCVERHWPARIEAVVSNRGDAPGLADARQAGLHAEVVEHGSFTERAAFDAALAARIESFQPDLVLLAGFMRILGNEFTRRFQGRLVNIHPSLLPSFGGMHTHRRALAEGVTLHGATVHLVTPAVDHGPIIAQGVVPVLPGDDERRLAARVLRIEHRLYPMAVQWLIEDRVTVRDGVVDVRDVAPGARLLVDERP